MNVINRTIGQDENRKVKITAEYETRKKEILDNFVYMPARLLYYAACISLYAGLFLFVCTAAVRLGLRF